MNNKALLLAILATTFSATTFTCVSEVEVVAVDTTEKSTTNQKPLAALKKIIDQDILNHCTENNTLLCQELLPALMALTDKIDLDADAEILFEEIHNQLKAELNKLNNPTTILKDATSETNEVAKEVCTALMVISQDQK